jgi:hypothetical protein
VSPELGQALDLLEVLAYEVDDQFLAADGESQWSGVAGSTGLACNA